MKEETKEKVRLIKQAFRFRMNGVTAHSMRQKGASYKLNWGISLIDLREMAKEYGKDYDLAVELWKADVRECKILATLIMPPQEMLPELADLWMEETHEQELAELAAFHLYQHLDDAPQRAYRWIAGNNELEQISGYLILARLFMRGLKPDQRGTNEYLDQAQTALHHKSMAVRHAATTSLNKFAELGEEEEIVVAHLMKQL